MDLSYGARLRLQRERAGVALSTIAEGTKIKLSLLEGLERGDLSAWPAGIFRRSYFREYANAIGLDPEAAVREFLDRYPDPLEEFASADEARPAGETSRWPTSRLRYLIDSAVGALPALRSSPPARLSKPVEEPSEARDDSAVIRAASNGQSAGDAAPPADGARLQLDGGDTIHKALRNGSRRSTSPVPAASSDVGRGTAGRPNAASRAGGAALDFGALAGLCTRLAAAQDAGDVAGVLAEAAHVLDACGLILWVWDPRARTLAPTLAHGYPDEILRRLPRVAADADNAIAMAFRTSAARVVEGSASATGAIVAPLVQPSGCSGALAVELRSGRESDGDVRAAAAILAAQIATLMAAPALAQAATA